MEDSLHLRDFRHQKQLIIMIRLNPLHSKTFTQFFYDRNEDLPCAIRKNPHFYFLYIRCPKVHNYLIGQIYPNKHILHD